MLYGKMGLCICVSAIPLRLWYCNSRRETTCCNAWEETPLAQSCALLLGGEMVAAASRNAKHNTSLFCMSPILWLTGSGGVDWGLLSPTWQ